MENHTLCLSSFMILFYIGGIMTKSTHRPTVVYGYENPETNLVTNWDFEDTVSVHEDWPVSNADHNIVSRHYTGSQSLHIYNREHRFGGPKNRVYDVKGNTMYYLSAFFRVLTNPNDMYSMIRLWIEYKDRSTGEMHSTHIAKLPKVRKSTRWRQLGGDFITPDIDLEFLDFFFEVPDWEIDYLIDSVSLIEIPHDPEWKSTCDSKIWEHRRSTIGITGVVPDSVPYCRLSLHVDQVGRHFGFGAAVQANRFIERRQFGPDYRKFQFDHFDWTVLGNSMKWKPMEPTKGNLKFDRVDRAIEYLTHNNQSIRGHAILWGRKNNNPTWVQSLSGTALKREIFRRVDYVVDHYKGQINQWDVMNEWLHGTWYDEMTNDVKLQKKIFKRIREIDPDAELYVNDYQIMRGGAYTSGIVDQVQELAHEQVKVDGIGAQSHLKNLPIEPERLQKRVEIVTASGLPLAITEFSVHSEDIQMRADQLDMALRIYFSSPGVSEIVLWFYSDQKRILFSDNMVLFEGPDFTPNAAGQVLLDRLAEWQTHETWDFISSQTFFETVHAYHGAYEVKLKLGDHTLLNQTFYLKPGDNEKYVTLDLSKLEGEEFEDDASTCIKNEHDEWINSLMQRETRNKLLEWSPLK